MIIFAILKRLFSFFVLPWDPEGSKKRALSRLMKDIDRQGPQWYRPWSNRLSSELAQRAEQLRKACARLSTVYALTIGANDGTARQSEAFILDTRLKDLGCSLEALSFESIRAEVEAKGKVDDIQGMNALFASRIKLLKTQEMNELAFGLMENKRIAAITAFSWEDLISPFGKAESGTAKSVIPALPVVGALEDLYFLLDGMVISDQGRRVFSLLRGSLPQGEYGPEQEEEDFAVLVANLAPQSGAAPLGSDAIGRAIRAAVNDPERGLRSDTDAADFRQSFVDELVEAYSIRRRIMEDRIMEERLAKIKSSVFGDAELIPCIGYTKELSEIFRMIGLPELTRVQPLSAVKSYLSGFYTPKFRPIISKAAIQLDFQNIEFRAALSDAAEHAAELQGEIEAFEETNASQVHLGLVGLASTMAERRLESVEIATAKKLIEEANKEADRILKETVRRFSSLKEKTQTLFFDIRAEKPQLVVDAALVTARHPEVPTGIEEVVLSLEQYLELLQELAKAAAAVSSGPARGPGGLV